MSDLLHAIEKKFGKKVKCAKDCIELSENIKNDIICYYTKQTISDNEIANCEKFCNSYLTRNNSFQYILLIQCFLVDYYKGIDLQKSLDFANQTLDLSQHCNYKLYEAKILINWPIGDENKLQKGKNMIEHSGFNSSIF